MRKTTAKQRVAAACKIADEIAFKPSTMEEAFTIGHRAGVLGERERCAQLVERDENLFFNKRKKLAAAIRGMKDE